MFLIIVTALFACGYSLYFYGGHLAESGRVGNIYLVIAKLIMWPVEVFVCFSELFNVKNKSFSIIELFLIHYTGYAVLFSVYIVIQACRPRKGSTN